MTTPSSDVSHDDGVRTPMVSPRFGMVVPPSFAPDGVVTHAQGSPNPDLFETRVLTAVAPKNPDGTPMLVAEGHKVTPLDLAQSAKIVRERRQLWDGKDADGSIFSDEERQYVIRDSSRKYAFTGVRLAYVSSEAHKPRWTEIEIYRNTGGIYLVHRVNVTSLVHLAECPQITVFHKKYTPGINGIAQDELAPQDREACTECNPDLDTMLHLDPASLKFERDRHQVHICETPEAVIQVLHTGPAGKRVLGPLAGSAISMSADRDAYIGAVFYGKTA